MVCAVTGAFGFSGRYITKRLVAAGHRVVNLTYHPDRPNEFGDAVTCAPLAFQNVNALAESMRGAEVFYNSYWIRFAHGDMTFDRAVENSKALVQAAKIAGVSRIVHISITNPSADTILPYFHGKAIVEEAIKDSGLSYAILRPAVIFGDEGILINNIAWFLRKLPVFAIPGDGEYKLQPILVDDLADLAVSAGVSKDNFTIDAVGPEAFAFNELIDVMKNVLGTNTIIVHVHTDLVRIAIAVMDRLLGDVVLTADEIVGLSDDLLVSDQPATGNTRLSDWLNANKKWLGRRYFSELRKHYK